MTEATVTVETYDDDVRLSLVGEVDLANADVVEDRIHKAIDNKSERVVLDLTGTTYIDSAGIRILVDLADRLEQLRIPLNLIAAPTTVPHRVIELTGLTTFLIDREDGRGN